MTLALTVSLVVAISVVVVGTLGYLLDRSGGQ